MNASDAPGWWYAYYHHHGHTLCIAKEKLGFCTDFLMKILSCSHGCYIRSKNYLESCHKWNYPIFKDTIISCDRKLDDQKEINSKVLNVKIYKNKWLPNWFNGVLMTKQKVQWCLF